MSQKILIFDMDGTLVDSSRGITSAINLVRAQFHLPRLEVQTVVNAINGIDTELPFIFYETQTYGIEHKKLFEEFYHDECIKELYIYDGIKELLCELCEAGIKCNVATNAPVSFAHRILKHLDIHHHFDHIVGASDYKSKPHPDMLNAILSNYGYDKKLNMLSFMIGDSLKDVHAALNADIKPIHIQWGFSSESFEYSVKSPKEIIKLLDIN